MRRIQRRERPVSSGSDVAGHPVLRRVYEQRGVRDKTSLDYSLQRLAPADALSGIDDAVELLEQALTERHRIVVIGDFDADGATSTAVALRGLRALGAAEVDYLVPNRFDFGYGLTPEIVAVAAESSPNLIITVDNGVASIDGVEAAHAHGIKVLVTDHHLPGEQLPQADAMVNPNLPDDNFPSKNLAGVGVIFYVLLALRRRLRDSGWFVQNDLAEFNLAGLLDLVALGTVADVVPLDFNNRILVEQGLRRIRAGQCVPGIKWLLQIGARDPRRVVASDMGFAAGPRLNAAGRLADMSLGIECLLSEDESQARELAVRLDELNRERREVEQDMQAQALKILGSLGDRVAAATMPSGICLYDETWHQGVIGILAGRIKDRLQRPVIAFAVSGAEELKGSARSVEGIHIRDVLATIDTRLPGLVTRFGGHAMAAGLSLPLHRYEEFCAAFEQCVAEVATAEHLEGKLLSDGELDSNDLSLELAEALRHAGPWGQGFSEPLFDGVFDVLAQRIVGERHLKLVLRADDGQESLDAIAFNVESYDWREDCKRVRVAYRLDVNEYRGSRSAQLVVAHLEPL